MEIPSGLVERLALRRTAVTETALEAVVEIERIAAGGDGVGRWPDGRVVFVPRTAPGDKARVRIVLARTRFLKGRLVELVDSSGDRVDPVCRHYTQDDCGGCRLMHLSGPSQLAAKSAMVGDAMRRIGKFDLPDPPVEPSPASLGYRRKITLSRVGLGKFGFHRSGEPGSVMSLEHCHLAAPRVAAMWDALRGRLDGLPATADRLVLREDGAGGLHLIHLGVPASWNGDEGVHRAFARAGLAVTEWAVGRDGSTRQIAGPEPAVAGLAFEQVNPEVARAIRSHAVGALGEVTGVHVWDLYAGIGDTAAMLAGRGARVSAVESVAAAVESAPELDRVRWYRGKAEQVAARLDPPEMVVANPPRTGMAGELTAVLVDSGAARLAYVSCDPATMARDCRRLASAYGVVELRAWDMFPQTAHVECLTVLERR